MGLSSFNAKLFNSGPNLLLLQLLFLFDGLFGVDSYLITVVHSQLTSYEGGGKPNYQIIDLFLFFQLSRA